MYDTEGVRGGRGTAGGDGGIISVLAGIEDARQDSGKGVSTSEANIGAGQDSVGAHREDNNTSERATVSGDSDTWHDEDYGYSSEETDNTAGEPFSRSRGGAGSSDGGPGCYYVPLAAPLDRVPLLVRGGSVLPTQPPQLTTTAT